MRSVLAVILVAMVGVACQQNDFAGDARRGANDAEKNKPDPEPDGPALGSDTKPEKTDKGQPKDEGKDDHGGDVGSGATPPDPAGIGSDPSIVDILDGLFGSDSDIVPNQPDDNTIDFGNDRFFHIGDNNLGASSCKAELSLSVLDGVQFYFEFDVKKADTRVELRIQKVCGVDYEDSNEVRILNVTKAIEVKKQPIASRDQVIVVSAAGLAVGKYMVIVESLPNAGSGTGDRDDYLVGQVMLKADKAIRAGKVGAR